MNVIGSKPDGWWRDRRGAMARLVNDLPAPATVVFDGAPFEVDSPEGIEVVFASRRGRNAADDDIVSLIASDPDPASLVVVTSDADLARRVEDLGASVEGAGAFRRRLEGGG